MSVFEPEIGDLIRFEDQPSDFEEVVVVLNTKCKLSNGSILLKVLIIKRLGSRHYEGLCDRWGFVPNDSRFTLLGRLHGQE